MQSFLLLLLAASLTWDGTAACSPAVDKPRAEDAELKLTVGNAL